MKLLSYINTLEYSSGRTKPGIMTVQTKCKLSNADLFLELFHIPNKEIGVLRKKQENLEYGIW